MWKDDRKSYVYSQDTFFSEVKTFHSVFHSLLGEKKKKKSPFILFSSEEWKAGKDKNEESWGKKK